MFKIFARRAKEETESVPQPQNVAAEAVPVPEQDSGKPQLDLIVVPKSAFDAYPTAPEQLVQALVDYVNHMTGRGRYLRDELPPEAIQAFHCDYYLTQVLNGGHSQFVANAKTNREAAIEDVLCALEELGATQHLALAQKMAAWVSESPQEADKQTGFEEGISSELAALDDPFFDYNKAHPLRERLADWLAGLEILQVVEDEKLPQVLEGIARLNERREHRDKILRVASIVEKMSHPIHLGMGMAAGSAPQVEAIVAVGNGSYRDVSGERKLCFALRTSAGKRWGIADETGATICEWIEHEDNKAVPSDLSNITMDDIKNWRPPEIGAVISKVEKGRIDAAAQICDQLHAAAAIDLLLSKCTEVKNLDAVSIRSIGPDPTGALGLSALIVANKGRLALSAIVTEQEARLLTEPEHTILASVTSAEIAEYDDETAMENFS